MKRKRLIVIGILCFFLIQIMHLACSQGTVTELNISNAPPVLLEEIPDQAWQAGQNLTNAFDLDNYFYDANGELLDYSYSAVENITVVIVLGIVSFFPDYGFVGTRNLTFYASDSLVTTPSNLVSLFVGTDEEPPQWSNPTKNRATIYQSMYVNFTTLWTDNFQLKNFYFSINQGGGWTTYSSINFSGKNNVSTYQVQISAAPGSTVSWKFCAYDTSLNSNCTEIQTFSVERRDIPPSPIPPTPISDIGVISRVFPKRATQNFTVEPSSFMVSMKQGNVETRVLKITNIGGFNMSFNLSVLDIEGMVYLSEESFDIPPGGSKEITIDFITSLSTPPSQYFGVITLTSSEVRYIPLVINVNALELKFDLQIEIPAEYKQIMPGETVRANISILNLEDVLEDNMTLYLAIKDFYGNVYDSREENFVFNSSLFLERNFTLSSEISEGKYLFYGRAFTYDDLALDSDTFELGSRFTFLASLRSSFIFLLIFLLCFVALVLMVVYSRSKEKERILSLYLMLNELKNALKEDKSEAALELYVRIKRAYGEPVSKSALQNREKLKEEIKNLSSRLKAHVQKIESMQKQSPKEQPKDKNKAIPEKKSEEELGKTTQKPTEKQTFKEQPKKPEPQKTKSQKQIIEKMPLKTKPIIKSPKKQEQPKDKKKITPEKNETK